MSSLSIRSEDRGGRTVITDCAFSSPIKIAKPFYKNAYTELMMMSASAGLLEGDEYNLTIRVGEHSALKFTGQSYTKVFCADKRGVKQRTNISVEKGGKLTYMPCPVIPFRGSIYSAQNEIRLSKDSTFALCDILSCGRAAMGEYFEFALYRSRTAVYVEDRLVLLDNVRLCPREADYSGIGFFEGYTHTGLIYVYGSRNEIILPQMSGVEAAQAKALEGICIRAAANSADEIVRFAEQITAPLLSADLLLSAEQ